MLPFYNMYSRNTFYHWQNSIHRIGGWKPEDAGLPGGLEVNIRKIPSGRTEVMTSSHSGLSSVGLKPREEHRSHWLRFPRQRTSKPGCTEVRKPEVPRERDSLTCPGQSALGLAPRFPCSTSVGRSTWKTKYGIYRTHLHTHKHAQTHMHICSNFYKATGQLFIPRLWGVEIRIPKGREFYFSLHILNSFNCSLNIFIKK